MQLTQSEISIHQPELSSCPSLALVTVRRPVVVAALLVEAAAVVLLESATPEEARGGGESNHPNVQLLLQVPG